MSRSSCTERVSLSAGYKMWSGGQRPAELPSVNGRSGLAGYRHHLRQPGHSPRNDGLLARTRAKGLNLGILAWSPLASGVLTGKYQGEGKADGAWMTNEGMKDFLPKEQRAARIISAVKSVSAQVGRSMAQVALAWFELSACSGLTGKPEVIDVSPLFCLPSIRQNPISSSAGGRLHLLGVAFIQSRVQSRYKR